MEVEEAKRVLVVEDDPDSCDAFCTALRDFGFEPVAARSGKEALAILRGSAPPDAILLDLLMPEMDGWQFRKEQLSDAALARIPVIAISAATLARNSALSFGARTFLGKPVDFDDLRGAVETATRERKIADA